MRRPKIRAELVLDGAGQPVTKRIGSLLHYRLRLWMEGVPSDTTSVTYILHPTFYERVREVEQEPFELKIYTYGDFQVQATISYRASVDAAAEWLSDALNETYQQPDGAVRAAIQTISAN